MSSAGTKFKVIGPVCKILSGLFFPAWFPTMFPNGPPTQIIRPVGSSLLSPMHFHLHARAYAIVPCFPPPSDKFPFGPLLFYRNVNPLPHQGRLHVLCSFWAELDS